MNDSYSREKTKTSTVSIIMKLIRKDVLVSRWKLLFAAVFFSIVAPLLMMTRISFLFLVVFPLSLISIFLEIDFRSGAEIIYYSLPIKKSLIVIQKYFLALIFIIICPVLAYIFKIILFLIFPDLSTVAAPFNPLDDFLFYFFQAVLFICLYFPFYFLFGYQKGPNAVMVVVLLVIIIFDAGGIFPHIMKVLQWLIENRAVISNSIKIMTTLMLVSLMLAGSTAASIHLAKRRR